MARTPDNKVTRKTPLQAKMNTEERAAFDRAVERLGGTASSVVRDLPRIAWERDVLLDAGFPDGLTRDDLNAVLDVMNGHKLLVGPESGDALLGERLYADLADHGDKAYAKLSRRVAKLPHSQRVALEVWAMMLWERSDDTDYWNAELSKRAAETDDE